MSDIIFGTPNNDYLKGTDKSDYIYGFEGNDTLYGRDGNDTLAGGSGNDFLYGEAGDDTFIGGAGNDLLDGSGGEDTVDYSNSPGSIDITLKWDAKVSDGFGNTDTLKGIDHVVGSDHNDKIVGDESWANKLDGGAGNDTIEGLGDDDTLIGGSGNDTLTGSNPNQFDSGKWEYDKLTGDSGADTFVLGDSSKAYYQGSGYATITDFDWAEGDKIRAYGSVGDYSLEFTSWSGGSAQDTLVKYQGDIIAVIEDDTSVIIDLDFEFV